VRRAGALGALLLSAYALAALCGPEFRADSVNYFAYLRSVAFDHDLELDNEWDHWGYAQLPKTATGRRQNSQSIGPALLWAPFFAGAHLFVVSGLGRAYAADGYSAPYRWACNLGTITAVVLAVVLLWRELFRRYGRRVASLAVAGIAAGTSLAYYTLIVPTMAHGAAFAAATVYLYLLDRARRQPDVRSWALLGASLGVAMLMRHQALVLALAAAPTAVSLLAARRLRPASIVAAAGAGIAAFFPQLLVWKHLFGHWITQPQGGAFMDWTSPHLVQTLLSADRGFLTWTPIAALGLLGLGLLLRDRDERLMAGGALLAFLATAWINGGVADWAASDAFGARRYDVTLPFLAWGLAAFIERAAALTARHPLAAPAAAVLCLIFWNLGFIVLFRRGAYAEAAPLERVASDQARLAQRLSERALGGVFGPRGRAFVYDVFQAEYFYTSFNPGGTIAPAGDQAPERYLLGGWAKRGRRESGPDFRWAMAPAACVRAPLEAPFDMEIGVLAFAPAGAAPQSMALAVNGTEVGAAELGPDWHEAHFTVPRIRLVPGENELCLRFSKAMPEQDGVKIAAGVARIQLP
jgi:hypothetical protein